MPIRWKVVKKSTRGSISLDPNGRNKDYVREYKKGSIIEAEFGSFGLFCFETRRDARFFKEIRQRFVLSPSLEIIKVRKEIRQRFVLSPSLEIIKVRGIGRGKRIKERFSFVVCNDLRYNYSNTEDYLNVSYEKVPPGTICYDSVEVLT